MKKRLVIFFVVFFAVAFCAAYWVSPYVAVYSIKSAVENGDAEKLTSHIDFPKVRDSLKKNISAGFAMGGENVQGSQPGVIKLFSSDFMSSLAGGVIDKYITEEKLASAMHKKDKQEKQDKSGFGNFGRELKKSSVSMSYSGLDQFVVATEIKNAGTVKIILERHNLFWWRITGIDCASVLAPFLRIMVPRIN